MSFSRLAPICETATGHHKAENLGPMRLGERFGDQRDRDHQFGAGLLERLKCATLRWEWSQMVIRLGSSRVSAISKGVFSGQSVPAPGAITR